jgi:hypothetical protein
LTRRDRIAPMTGIFVVASGNTVRTQSRNSQIDKTRIIDHSNTDRFMMSCMLADTLTGVEP